MAVNKTIEQIVFEGIDKLTSPSKSAQGSVKDLRTAVDGVKDALAAVGITVGAGAFIKLHLDALKATAALDDMAEATGASVESLSAIRNVAKVGAHDFEGLTAQIGKVIRDLKNGTDEGNKTAHALKFLGVEARDANGHFRDTGQVLIDVAKAVNGYASDGDRVRLIQDALGRGAERYAPLLKDIAEGTDLVAKVTREQAEAAEQAEKNINRLKVAMEDAYRESVNNFTPAISKNAEALLAASNAADGFIRKMQLFFTLAGPQGDDPLTRIAEVEERLAHLGRLREALAGDNTITGRLNRLINPEDKAILDHQIQFAQQERAALQALLNRRVSGNAAGLVEDAAGFHAAPASPRSGYRSLEAGDAAREKRITEARNRGLEEFNRFQGEMLAEIVNVEQQNADERLKNLTAFAGNRTAIAQGIYALEFELLAESINADYEAQNEKLARLAVLKDEVALMDEEREVLAHEARMQRLAEFTDQELSLLGGRHAIEQGMEAQHQAKLLEIENRKHQAQRSMEITTVQLAGNLLQQVAGKSKGAALAVIAVNKGLAIAQTIMNTAAATMRAYAELGPIAGAVAAAKIQLIGKIQLGLIAATGLIDAGQALSGGGGGTAGGNFGLGGFTPGVPVTPVGPGELATPRQVETKVVILANSKLQRQVAEEIAEGLNELHKDGYPMLFAVEAA